MNSFIPCTTTPSRRQYGVHTVVAPRAAGFVQVAVSVSGHTGGDVRCEPDSLPLGSSSNAGRTFWEWPGGTDPRCRMCVFAKMRLSYAAEDPSRFSFSLLTCTTWVLGPSFSYVRSFRCLHPKSLGYSRLSPCFICDAHKTWREVKPSGFLFNVATQLCRATPHNLKLPVHALMRFCVP